MYYYPRDITPDKVNQLPLIRYEGKIHVIENPEDERRCLDKLQSESLLGFDTETRPTYRSGVFYPPALVQLAASDAVYLIRLTNHKFEALLTTLLESKKIVKAGVAVRDDVSDLQGLVRFNPQNFVDLSSIAEKYSIKKKGLRNLAALFLERRVSKNGRLSPWHQPKLTKKQIRYAATDAWISRELYLQMKHHGLIL